MGQANLGDVSERLRRQCGPEPLNLGQQGIVGLAVLNQGFTLGGVFHLSGLQRPLEVRTLDSEGVTRGVVHGLSLAQYRRSQRAAKLRDHSKDLFLVCQVPVTG